ncbi:MAG TPA: ABC-F family ATP-binding cassette domain-containing protein [Candidatus Baltobacteraceae bacterium]|nr:ABC-F family ATP-binding cassette domain-containing protein [Candidatus Baltobacteraceae bacterium]
MHVSGVLAEGQRIGLVGPNGAGKSSLLRLLAGVDTPYGGTIVRADAKLGYLSQSVADETQATLQELIDAALERASHEEFGLRNKVLREMLRAFGFSEADYQRPLRQFSGGQRAKAALAHVLIDDPHYLILDEPTNHLDIDTVRWLEEFIAADKRAYIVVSHDRYFLDRVATQIWEIERGTLRAYDRVARGAYTQYLQQKEARLEAERRAYEQYISERDKRRAGIAGLRATHTSSDYSQVRSREKQLARLEEQNVAAAPPPPPASIAVRLDSARRASNGFAFEAKDVSKTYAQPLFTNLTVDVRQGERVAIVGPNGAGKSTLLRIFAGELVPDRGTVRYNPAARTAYFTQNTHDQLDVTGTAVAAVLAAAPVTEERARNLLGRMRISGEAADKPVTAFSGGERRRIMLAALMARRADVLLLDEPTNDLDIDSREALESVLGEYEGAIVVVSHDRYLLGRLCERVLWIENGAWGVLDGGYEAYEATQRDRQRRTEETRDDRDARPKSSKMTPLKQRSKLETQIARVEREIVKIDARKAEIDALFLQPDVYADVPKLQALHKEKEVLECASTRALAEWEELSTQLEALG